MEPGYSNVSDTPSHETLRNKERYCLIYALSGLQSENRESEEEDSDSFRDESLISNRRKKARADYVDMRERNEPSDDDDYSGHNGEK